MAPSFPTAIAPRLPSVDRIARILPTQFGSQADTEIDLCVSGDGRVAQVTLVQGSAYEAFDAALLRDVKEWEFTARPAATSARVCKRTTVSYRMPS
ncbi:MAG: TonB family protein [Myxococcales bacterium]|nr:TonB family protein [Myxococcales bacterium]